MNKTILVNKIEIDKEIIIDLIKQGNYDGAIKLIANRANVKLKTARDIVQMFEEGDIDLFDGKDLFLFDYDEVSNSQAINRGEPEPSSFLEIEKSNRSGSKKGLIIGLSVLVIGFVFLRYVVGFNHIGHHLSELAQVFGKNDGGAAALDADTAVRGSSLEPGITRVADVEDFRPVDTNLLAPEFKSAEMAKIKNAQFDKLIPAKKSPTDEDAQLALIYFTNKRLTDVIIQQKLNIKIGQCYENPKKEGNQHCVSCMILLYNREKKDWQEAPDGENFLDNAYDFYLPEGGDTWEAKSLSMHIPFDYALFKKYEGKD
ncbi:hypothetical protein [Sphingobacterium sp. BIGb0165]|uniref:hypothetical protein n=1 Tax=Sphingobacterium sp. BIGb0165 TaxID=2940615 RepID=UPI0021698FC9|nr:hypothetical protein [Sphingobacterium sp. BIGb0165]MCS4224380.1 hypothetical protein [Sphingobacterium sp. BIGb0165]